MVWAFVLIPYQDTLALQNICSKKLIADRDGATTGVDVLVVVLQQVLLCQSESDD